MSYRRRFNLEEVLQEWEAEQDGAPGAPVPMEESRRGAPLPAPALEEDDEVRRGRKKPPWGTGGEGAGLLLWTGTQGALESGLPSLRPGADHVRVDICAPIVTRCATPSSAPHLTVPAAPAAEAPSADGSHSAPPATPTPAGPLPPAPAGPQPAPATSHPPRSGCLPPQCPPWPSAPAHPDRSPSGAPGTLTLSPAALHPPEGPRNPVAGCPWTPLASLKTEGTRALGQVFPRPGAASGQSRPVGPTLVTLVMGSRVSAPTPGVPGTQGPSELA